MDSSAAFSKSPSRSRRWPDARRSLAGKFGKDDHRPTDEKVAGDLGKQASTPHQNAQPPKYVNQPKTSDFKLGASATEQFPCHSASQPSASDTPRLVESSMPRTRGMSKRTTSDGGSSVANMKQLTIDDPSPHQPPISPGSITPRPPNSNKRTAGEHGTRPGPTKHRPGLVPVADSPASSRHAHPPRTTSSYNLASEKALQPNSDLVNPWSQDPGQDSPTKLSSSSHSPPRHTSLGSRGHLQPSAQSGSELVTIDPPSPVFQAFGENGTGILLQPETRPITQEQLVNEVKGIYAGLVMVEKKCVEIDQQQATTTNKLSNEQWQALIALHRTLLHEHHDFFLASQHPSSSPALRRLATKYAMPARMWRHGIHSFLELLRHRLPDSLEHMLAFVYLAYSMMALLMESVPSFEETWIECLGDLARYRMAIEEADLRDREVWSGVARMWYNKAADKSPNVGRIQHHLAVLARPNIVQQLYYYSKALGSEMASQRYLLVDSSLVKALGILFIHGSISEFNSLIKIFLAELDPHIGRITHKFRVQGPELASSLCATLFDSGSEDAFLSQAFRGYNGGLNSGREASRTATEDEGPTPEDPKARLGAMRLQFKAAATNHIDHLRAPEVITPDWATNFSSSDQVAAYGLHLLNLTVTKVLARTGDKNTLPFAHVILAFLFSSAFVPAALIYIEAYIPWETLADFLNGLDRSGVVKAGLNSLAFPQRLSGTGRQLPEDFVMRGSNWAQHYFPAGFFEGQVVDEDERTLELPSHAVPREERCLWLGIQLASLHRWLDYDMRTKQFSVTDFVSTLEPFLAPNTLDSRSQTLSVEREMDTAMDE